MELMGPVVRADVPKAGEPSRLLKLETPDATPSDVRAVLSTNMDTTLPLVYEAPFPNFRTPKDGGSTRIVGRRATKRRSFAIRLNRTYGGRSPNAFVLRASGSAAESCGERSVTGAS